MRIGQGYDSHRLVFGRDLILGGVKIPYEKGLYGHSDADCLIHAIIDAIIGALGEGDIGRHFPDNDNLYKDISGNALLEKINILLKEKKYCINNIDSTIIMDKPKLFPYIDKMRENISGVLGIAKEDVNIKAKTNEGMGFTGRLEGVEAQAVVLLFKKD